MHERKSSKLIGQILIDQGVLTQEQLLDALRLRGGRLASRLVEAGVVSQVAALKALSEQRGIPGIDLEQVCLRLEDLDSLPRETAEQHQLLPVLVRDDRIFVALANPDETVVIDELEFVTGKRVYPYLALEGALMAVIRRAYASKALGEAYYIGPRCPDGVLEKLGLERPGPAGPPPLPKKSRVRSVGEPAVVVDDALRASQSDEVEDSAFGQVSSDLSVVTELRAEAGASGSTILVVDDEDDIRRMLAKLLMNRGHRVIEADRGLLALRLVKEKTPDLIILDAMLPEVHGFDIARRIKGSGRYGEIPIIMVSAVYRGWRYAEDAKKSCGVDHYLEKPFRIADVIKAVEGCLHGGPPVSVQNPKPATAEASEALRLGVEAYKEGRLTEAVGHLRRGVTIDPLAYRLHFHLGLLYGRQDKVYEAIQELETAVDINSKHFPALKNLAILYQKAGFRNKAAETWERALLLAPDEETKASIRRHLLRLL